MLKRKPINTLSTNRPPFLWYPFIPFGIPSVFQGQAGYGKTTILFRVMAELSHGIYPPRLIRGGIKDRAELTEWEQYAIECMLRTENSSIITEPVETVSHNGVPLQGVDDEDLEETEREAPDLDPPFMRPVGEPIKMVYITRENPDAEIRRKYEMFGGDPDFLDVIDETKERFTARKDQIKDLVGDAKFVVIDPIFPFVDGRLSSNEDVDNMMHDFEDVAQETGAAILLLNNLTKNGTSDYNSGLGASNLKNITRSLFKLDKSKQFLYLASIKNNIASANGSIAVLMDDVGRAGFMNADRLKNVLSGTGGEADDEQYSDAIAAAIDFLEKLLDEGPVPSEEVFEAAQKSGISTSTLNRAKKEAGVESRRIAGNSTVWEWPEM